jgi:DNA-binding IclR family transcriptional regulator
LLATAGGKALLATCPDVEREAYLRRCGANDAELVSRFLGDLAEIRRTGIATNVRHNGARYAVATVLRNQSGEVVAAITLVGATVDMKPRTRKLGSTLLRHVDAWSKRSMSPREAI